MARRHPPELRRKAAELAVELRNMPLKGIWRRRDWNHKVRHAIRSYMDNMTYFYRVNRL